MSKRDCNIYGADENGFAQRVADESLDTSGAGEDIWGALVDDSARSKGARPNEMGPVKVKKVSTDGDKPGNSEGN